MFGKKTQYEKEMERRSTFFRDCIAIPGLLVLMGITGFTTGKVGEGLGALAFGAAYFAFNYIRIFHSDRIKQSIKAKIFKKKA